MEMVRGLSEAPSAWSRWQENSSQLPLASHGVESAQVAAETHTQRLLGIGGFFDLRAKIPVKGGVFIGVLIPTRRGLDILTNLSPSRLQITVDKRESQKGINPVSTKRTNGYELGFGLGNPPIDSDQALSGWFFLAEQVRARWFDWAAAMGQLGRLGKEKGQPSCVGRERQGEGS
jgi:hypothetical protein